MLLRLKPDDNIQIKLSDLTKAQETFINRLQGTLEQKHKAARLTVSTPNGFFKKWRTPQEEQTLNEYYGANTNCMNPYYGGNKKQLLDKALHYAQQNPQTNKSIQEIATQLIEESKTNLQHQILIMESEINELKQYRTPSHVRSLPQIEQFVQQSNLRIDALENAISQKRVNRLGEFMEYINLLLAPPPVEKDKTRINRTPSLSLAKL